MESKKHALTGKILTGLSVAFLLFDGGAKIAKIKPVIDVCTELQIPVHLIPAIGIVLLVCTILYAVPATSLLGAVLLTGYLGGATWTHVRMDAPLFPILFPSIVGTLVWGGLYLREPRLGALLPFRK